MDHNQLPPNESLSLGVSRYSVMESAHPMDNNEDSKVQIEGHGTPGVMPEWFTQLMTRANNNNSHRSLEQFQKMKPPVFEREVDPLQAKAWLLQIEKILDVMNCTDKQRVSFSSFMFQKEAEYWWRAVKNSVKSARESITWEFLVNKFTEKYILETTRDKMASEFLKLR